jgi:hypothetical protein
LQPVLHYAQKFAIKVAEKSRQDLSTLLRDPYEKRSVYVAASTIPGAGEGLFAKRNFEQRELISYYA